ncbi:hypothetical protein Acr_24g0007500 [Actinidia rufa]|uniref:Uncharacterized protein n=1 Tax=Actinidia rufa TaxID=165716 RepID=A0A7J0GUP7_9ERIC|nr:hypothetical protein Acr_24g0007500 [Actinidia rufa]
MDPDVRDLVSLLREELVKPLDDHPPIEDVRSPPKKETNIITQGQIGDGGILRRNPSYPRRRLPEQCKGVEEKVFSSFQWMTGSLTMENLGSSGFQRRRSSQARRCNKQPSLTKVEKERTKGYLNRLKEGEYSRGNNKERGDDAVEVAQVLVDEDSRTFGIVPTLPVGGDKAATAHPGVVLGLESSVIKDPSIAKKQARSFLFSADMEMVGKLELDEVATRFYHVCTKMLVMGSSLVERAREMREGVGN